MDQLYMNSDFSNAQELVGINREDVLSVFNETLTYAVQIYGSKRFEYRRLLNGYRRFDPTRGMEYLLDLAFRDRWSGLEVHKRFEAVRPLGKVEIVPIPYVTENTRITLLLLVDADNHIRTSRFLDDYAQVCLKSQDNTVLALIFIYDPHSASKKEKDDIYKEVKKMANAYSNKYESRGTKVFSINIKSVGLVPLEMGIIDLIVKRFPSDTLFFICTPDMEIKGEFLNRVRMNTIQGWQVFIPIPFVQYHPGIVYKDKSIPAKVEVNKSCGHFDVHNYNYVSFYATDYLAGRKMSEKDIPIVRSEKDLDEKAQRLPFGMYHMFINMHTLHVLRAAEPGLPIRYTYHKCEPTLNKEAYEDCTVSRTRGLASRRQLAELVFEQHRRKHMYVNKNLPMSIKNNFLKSSGLS